MGCNASSITEGMLPNVTKEYRIHNQSINTYSQSTIFPSDQRYRGTEIWH